MSEKTTNFSNANKSDQHVIKNFNLEVFINRNINPVSFQIVYKTVQGIVKFEEMFTNRAFRSWWFLEFACEQKLS